ncbi:MAG: DNA primase [Candidatus Omnitrophica bacterium]|nr:DNA primase [Candidatus Omnitrophota bacterium]MDD5081391.1 DNA primase [Candidatus Omnitrophota bacterium]MDD5440758.1 DNA primase [Candidatus Omnitrophota bacterium]
MIPQSFIDEVQSKIDIVELIGSYIPMKRAGRNYRALCPFHGEKTASFMISPQKQIFHCFGCGEGGGAIQFVMLYEKVGFVEALEILAKRVGVELPRQDNKIYQTKVKLYEIMSMAVKYFHEQIIKGPQRKTVMQYLKSRGITESAIDKFKIGYAPQGDMLSTFMRSKNFTLGELEKVSLVVSRGEMYQDLFKDRIVFPIADVRGRYVAIGARVWGARESMPKYINSVENVLYRKRENLYGIDLAKDYITKEDCVFVVEGYLDVIVPFVNGIKNIVASSGTALTDEQIALIRRYTKNVVLVFDADKAGRLAALRAIDLLLEKDMNVMTVTLPDGQDPDSLVREKGAKYVLELFSRHESFFDFKFKILKERYDLKNINDKVAIASDMMATIDKISNSIKKHEYVKKLAYLSGINEENLYDELKKTSKTSVNKNYKTDIASKNIFLDKPWPVTEKVIIKSMLLNKQAQDIVKQNLDKEDFSHILSKKIVSYFLSADEPVNIKTVEDSEINSIASFILMDDTVQVTTDIFKDSVLKIKSKKIKNVKENIKTAIKEAEELGDFEKVKSLIGQYRAIKG